MYAIRRQRGYDVPLEEVMRAVTESAKVRTSNNKELLDYFAKNLRENPSSSLDMNFFSTYESRFGFRFNFEVLTGAPLKDSIY